MKHHIGSWILFASLCLLGGIIILFPSYRFSALVTFTAAGLVLCYQLLRLLAQHSPALSGVLRCILTVGICVVLLGAAVTGFFVVRAANTRPSEDCDYLIVLGAGVNGTVPSLTLRERLDAACIYLQAHPDTQCIVSGGQGPGELISEAECMANWLTDKGISSERILLEDQATSTQENLRFSKALIDARCSDYSIGIVSSEYHLFRAGLMAKDQSIDPILIPARTTWFSLRFNYYLREIAATWFYVLFGA